MGIIEKIAKEAVLLVAGEEVDNAFSKVTAVMDKGIEALDRGIEALDEYDEKRLEKIVAKVKAEYPNSSVLYEDVIVRQQRKGKKIIEEFHLRYLSDDKSFLEYHVEANCKGKQKEFDLYRKQSKVGCVTENARIGHVNVFSNTNQIASFSLKIKGIESIGTKYSIKAFNPILESFNLYYEEELLMKKKGKRIIVIDKDREAECILFAVAMYSATGGKDKQITQYGGGQIKKR